MHRYSVLMILCCGTFFAQNAVHEQRPKDFDISDCVPRPYVFVGPELMGGGYAPVAWLAGTGMRLESPHLTFDANAAYDNGHKTNDGTQPNPKGHDRGLDGAAYYRLSSGWAFGGGYGWSQLSTTNYTKSGSRPRLGMYKDFFTGDCKETGCHDDFTMRIGADYLSSGSDKQNSSHGIQFSFYAPSPQAKKHVFYRETISIYRFHDTVTDPTNIPLTREQVSNKYFDCFAEFTLMYRF